jgi:hypothetical protein
VAIAEAARDAARTDFDDPGDQFVTRIKNMAVFGNAAGTGAPLVNGLTPAHVNVSWTRDAADVPQTMTLAVQGYSINSLFGTLTCNNKPLVTMRYAGRYVRTNL